MAYDSFGRASSVTTLLDGKTYSESSTYDQFGRGYQSFFSAPGVNQTGELVEYNGQGYLFRVRSAFTPALDNPSLNMGVIYNEVTAMNARGQVTDEIRMAGAHVETKREYDTNTGRLKRIQSGGGFLQDLSYDYDKLGNMKYRQDTTDPLSTLREDFTYDKLQRLLSSTVTKAGTTQSNQDLTFWGNGNIKTKTDVGTYMYGTKPTQCNSVSGSVIPGPHAVSSVGTTNYCYDANGNLLRTFNGASSDKTLVWTAYDQVATMSSAANDAKVGFEYGPGRERIRRLDYATAFDMSAQTVTHFVGSAEVRWTASGTSPGGFEEVRRYVGGVIVVQRGTGSSQTIRREYLLTDAQGSTYAVLDDFGMPINASARMSFDPFGKRRAAADWVTPTPWLPSLGAELKDTTRRGYTGHEQVDAVGIIHMGGRIYDPHLGRFLQADPYIQAPGNSQSLNRYTYVFNNPMAYTDPTGYWGAREQAGLRTVVAIVIACYTGYYASVATTASNGAAIAFAGGFAAGAVQTGTLKGAVIGGISSLAFFGVAKAFPVKGMNLGTSEGMAAYSKLALASGVTGGVMAEVQGGRFGNGFVSAGASAFLSPIPEGATSNPAGQTVVAAVIGGTISRATGGKFANGAVTGAFQFAMGRAVAKVRVGGGSKVHLGGGSDPGDPELADLVTNRVNDVLNAYGIIGKKYGTQEELALAWAAVVDPTANYVNNGQGVEVGSLIYEVDGGFMIAGAWSAGSRDQVSGLFQYGPQVSGGRLSAFIHNHPVNTGFSDPRSTYYSEGGYIVPAGDIATAYSQRIDAFVSMRNGQVDRWSYSAMKGTISNSIASQIPANVAPMVSTIRKPR